MSFRCQITAAAMGDDSLFAGNVWQNDDVSCSCMMSNTLVIDENGQWASLSAIDFFGNT